MLRVQAQVKALQIAQSSTDVSNLIHGGGFVQQAALVAPSVKYSASIEYATQTDEIIREALRQVMSGTPGPAYIEYPSHVILEDLDVPAVRAPSAYRLVNQSAGAAEIAAAIMQSFA